jgi:hypothetical protein
MKLAGRLTVTVGALAFIVALALPYHSGSEGGQADTNSVWQISTREGFVLTLVALLAAALAVVTSFRDAPVLVLVQPALGLYLFGNFFLIGLETYSETGAGFWLGTAAALAVAAGGALSIAAIWPRGGWRSTTGWRDQPAPAGEPPAPPR